MNKIKKIAIVVSLLAMAALVFVLSGPRTMAQIPDLKNMDLNKAKDMADKYNEANKPWTNSEERATGRVLAAQVAKSFGGLWTGKDGDAWTLYVNEIGRALVPYCKRPDIKYRFAILNSNDVNAYSCPGGYIFVTKGLLKQVDNEAQLAGVLAHEIAHVSERHIEKQVRTDKNMSMLLDAGVTFADASGKVTKEQVDLAKNLSNAGYEVLVKKGYNQKDEFEADRIGTRTLKKLGYDPEGLLTFVKTLESAKGGMAVFSTHPPSPERVKRMQELIQEKNMKVQGKPDLKARLDDMKAKHPVK